MSVWNLFNTVSTALFGAMDEIPDPANVPLYDSDRYVPSIQDVLAVKQVLNKKGHLPLELVDTIIDFAEYWVRTTTCRTGGEITVNAGQEWENKLLLRSYPIGYLPTKDNPTTLRMAIVNQYPSIDPTPRPELGDFPHNVTREICDRWIRDSSLRGEFPCRKIVFTVKSHDQGWGGLRSCRGTYKGSSTWFDVGLERVSAFRNSQLPPMRSTEPSVGGGVRPDPDDESKSGGIYEVLGTTALPYFSFSDLQSTTTDPAAIICFPRTIIPTTESRQTATEPPETKYFFRHALDPSLDCLQRNLTATRDIKKHKVIWSYLDHTDPDSVDGKKLDEEGRGRATGNGEYVRNLKVGDVVTVWGKARYQGWANFVREVKIDIYWAV